MTQEPLGQYRILLKAFNILWLKIYESLIFECKTENCEFENRGIEL